MTLAVEPNNTWIDALSFRIGKSWILSMGELLELPSTFTTGQARAAGNL